jgi:AcrR family transcriptional regulator
LREFKSIEEKIMDRALYLVGKNHSLNISVRAIAKEAEVNISAINYYFRTKEELMRQVRELYITNTLSISSILMDMTLESENKLITAINEVMEYILRYPGITVLLKDAREREDDISVRILEVSNEMTEKLNTLLDEFLTDTDNLSAKHIIFWSAVNYPVEGSGFANYNSDYLKERSNRLTYIRQLLQMLRK